jgi:hypothetical protein
MFRQAHEHAHSRVAASVGIGRFVQWRLCDEGFITLILRALWNRVGIGRSFGYRTHHCMTRLSIP